MTEQEKQNFMLDELEMYENDELVSLNAEKSVQQPAPAQEPAAAPAQPQGQPGAFTPIDLPGEVDSMVGNDITGNPGLPADSGVTPNSEEKVMFNLSELLPADTVISLMDFLFPLLAIYLAGYFGIKEEKDREQIGKDLELEAKERKTIAKPLERALQQTTTGTKNPWVALIIVVLVIYGGKIFASIMDAKARKQEADNKAKELEQAQGKQPAPAPPPAAPQRQPQRQQATPAEETQQPKKKLGRPFKDPAKNAQYNPDFSFLKETK